MSIPTFAEKDPYSYEYDPFSVRESYGLPTGNSGADTGGNGFIDWWNKMPEEKKSALTRGVMSAGLKMMEAGGRTYRTPVNALSIMGSGGMAGLQEYDRTLDSERANTRADRAMGLNEEYLGLAKNREARDAELYDTKKPYVGKGLQLGIEETEIRLEKLRNPVTKPELTPSKAYQRRSSIANAVARLKSDSPVDESMLDGMSSDLRAFLLPSLGKTLDPEAKAAAIKAYEDELAYIETFIPSPANRGLTEDKKARFPSTAEKKKRGYISNQAKGLRTSVESPPIPAPTPASGKTIIQTGTYNGRKVIKYSDGSIEYAD